MYKLPIQVYYFHSYTYIYPNPTINMYITHVLNTKSHNTKHKPYTVKSSDVDSVKNNNSKCSAVHKR